jgi:hypothetical protein
MKASTPVVCAMLRELERTSSELILSQSAIETTANSIFVSPQTITQDLIICVG